ncbi:hypothetical protein P152DRAFT_461673 [Eremomyces bilateralis CBS 781.70]|uniref:Phytase-like domain-containing protein n=1 Tax=Eremomyces bilateralis CBS 781.70 TaxID=1392243 RepID=A0A6G1FU71_9PEZI|nr:uncharacterized protein P152DRAFT_461673 [Eremomyces bilateralis CBS 781.70]KAF1809256.1 hypothetical protein P152DRAFT_461673 [Eremomyces bilateralis CBS 781.70]
MRSLAILTGLASLAAVVRTKASTAPATIDCNGKPYTNHGLVGAGILAGNLTDKYGDTLGGIGSSAAIERGSWKKLGRDKYTGRLWGLPDRGWNTEGTLNFNPRVHKFQVTLDLGGTRHRRGDKETAEPNVHLRYLDTILLTDPNGEPTTGLDPDPFGVLQFPGFPDLPAASYVGDGFGTVTTGDTTARVSIDSEGLVLNDDGTFWISDEYGDMIYRFRADGRMLDAIRPPDAFLPRRNATVSFNANSPPRYDSDREITPGDPLSGRNNNQGLEGMTASPDGKTLYALTQSALINDGASSSTRFNARLLVYDLSRRTPRHTAEYVVQLPRYARADGASRVAAQSEIHYLSATQFLVLSRDGDVGRGMDATESRYRQVDIFDIGGATDVKEEADCATCAVVVEGVLDAGITPARYCEFVDVNDNAQLGSFEYEGIPLHNGGAQDAGLLNEKWESLAIVPVNGKRNGRDCEDEDDEYFMFMLSDNDFITQHGKSSRSLSSPKTVPGFRQLLTLAE